MSIGRGIRRLIAIAVGVAIGGAAAAIVYLLIFAAVAPDLVKAGETSPMGGILAVVALVFGSAAHSMTFKQLERRAQRAAEAERLPRAQLR